MAKIPATQATAYIKHAYLYTAQYVCHTSLDIFTTILGVTVRITNIISWKTINMPVAVFF